MLLYQTKLGSCLETQEAELYHNKVNRTIKKSLNLNDKKTTQDIWPMPENRLKKSVKSYKDTEMRI